MSSSVCHAPLPSRMEAFTTRICLRAVDQYERLLQTHFHKPTKGGKESKESKLRVSRKSRDRVVLSRSNKQQDGNENNDRDSENIDCCKKTSSPSNGTTYSAVNVFRQWRKNGTNNVCDNRNVDRVVNDFSSIGCRGSVNDDNKSSSSLLLLETTMQRFPNVLSDVSRRQEDMSLKYLALNALELTAPASDVLLKNRLKSWFQLSGHPDGFAPAGPGTVWKRRTGGAENTERIVYETLSKDENIRDCIPRYYREVEYQGDTFIELQDLLFGFNDPHVMDIKLGTRTFLESEVSKTIARTDLYLKMIAVDPTAPTELEHRRRAVTKLRYMQFREQQSSTCSHGFRIEAMKLPGAPPITDLKKVKSHEKVFDVMRTFLADATNTRKALLERLYDLRSRIENSDYFKTHEVIGSSIFMIYDNEKVGVWIIDFAKTSRVPDGRVLSHRVPWVEGNHEEGFLLGLDNLIAAIERVVDSLDR